MFFLHDKRVKDKYKEDYFDGSGFDTLDNVKENLIYVFKDRAVFKQQDPTQMRIDELLDKTAFELKVIEVIDLWKEDTNA